MILDRGHGEQIAYEHFEGSSPGIVFLSGFNSNMQGDKALALDAWCRESGRQFTRFDYQGHGQSSGKFEDGSIGRWIDDALTVLDEVASGPQLLVGSSMGGWIMLQVALARSDRVAGLIGIAAAPDFTDALANGGLSPEQMLQLELSGSCAIDNCYDDGEPYQISKNLLEEGRQHCLLNQQAIDIQSPVRLLHGQRDSDVPWERSLALAEKLTSDDVELLLIKDGEHRLSRGRDLQRLFSTIAALLGDLD